MSGRQVEIFRVGGRVVLDGNVWGSNEREAYTGV
jgi:predicted kinase